MAVGKKGTILIVSGPKNDPDKKHLHVVCTDPDENGDVLLVPVCSVGTTYHDPTCLLQDHEHPFLRHDSYICYAKSQVTSTAALTTGIATCAMIVHAEINGQSFLRVKNGICRSRHTPKKIKNYAGCPAPEPSI